jgi:hypothetical protein
MNYYLARKLKVLNENDKSENLRFLERWPMFSRNWAAFWEK